MTARKNWAKSSSAVDLRKKKKASVDENVAGKFEIFRYKLDLPRCMIHSIGRKSTYLETVKAKTRNNSGKIRHGPPMIQ